MSKLHFVSPRENKEPWDLETSEERHQRFLSAIERIITKFFSALAFFRPSSVEDVSYGVSVGFVYTDVWAFPAVYPFLDIVVVFGWNADAFVEFTFSPFSRHIFSSVYNVPWAFGLLHGTVHSLSCRVNLVLRWTFLFPRRVALACVFFWIWLAYFFPLCAYNGILNAILYVGYVFIFFFRHSCELHVG